MKFDSDSMRNTFSKWLMVSIISANTKEDPQAEERFNQLINAPGYDSSNLDFKLMVNGVPFDLMPDTFEAIEKHIEDTIEERAQASAFAIEKMEAMQNLLKIKNSEDLRDFLSGN